MAGDVDTGSPLPPPLPDEQAFSPGAAGEPGAAETAADGVPSAGLPPRPRVLPAVTLMLVGSALSLLGAFLRMPFLTAGVIFRIHWQAAKLFIKGVPFFKKPLPPSSELSR